MNSPAPPVVHPAIMFSCAPAKRISSEDYASEHVLCHVVAGEMRLLEATRQFFYRAGDTVLVRRNHLVKYDKRSLLPGTPFQGIFLVLDRAFLRDYTRRHPVPAALPGPPPAHEHLRTLEPYPALRGLFESLRPYLGTAQRPSAALTQLKLHEALLCLLEQAPDLSGWLFDFAEPGKLDLAAFMHRHYMFNLPVSKFAELTGRSTSAFQRDFRRHFGLSTATWLLQRRLEAAHVALLTPGSRPSEVYLEVGFEDLAHFSRSFKKAFGYNPSQVARQANTALATND